MKRIICGITVSLLAASSANAALMGRQPATPGGSEYQAYYDTELNITWLADANYAKTSGYHPEGRMNWNDAQSWIGSLNAANHLGVNDWRLPTTTQPDSTCSDQLNPGGGFPLQGYGYYCTGSEMGFLYTLEGISSGTPPDPFTNVRPNFYWSGTAHAAASSRASGFMFDVGYQGYRNKDGYGYAWAVRPGDIAPVPVPGALWLFGTGLAAVAAKLRRRVGHEAQ